MAKLKDIAYVIRSKNAGPYVWTFDIFFKDPRIYQKIKEKKLINKDLIKKLYKVTDEEILNIIYYDPALAIKFNLKRKIPSGSLKDRDIYGAQQHAPLLDAEIEI